MMLINAKECNENVAATQSLPIIVEETKTEIHVWAVYLACTDLAQECTMI